VVRRCGPRRSGAVHWIAGCRRDARTPCSVARGRGEECRHNAASQFAGSSVPRVSDGSREPVNSVMPQDLRVGNASDDPFLSVFQIVARY
jgi:hypothetical protein